MSSDHQFAAVSDPMVEPAVASLGGLRRFAALHNKDCRRYLIGGALAMMADNIEHVITYWVLWETFHSPWLAGFEVISHWTPFLLFSVYFGSLADRRDCRRLIQAAQILFMAVSAAWGVLFVTGGLQMWHAVVLLVLHGLAGSLWSPAEQLMLHDFVGPRDLGSAVRLNATFRSLGILFGPVVGSVLLLGLGPAGGIFANVAIYLPLTMFLARTRFTGHTRDGVVAHARLTLRGAGRLVREVAQDHSLISMIVLAGLGSFFVGAALQTVMPAFAQDFGVGDGGSAYGVLLFATGLGGVLGGLLMEAAGRIRATPALAVVSTLVYGAAILAFTLAGSYLLAISLLLVAGVGNLASMATTQTIVQLLAEPRKRGQVIGLYGMSGSGARLGSGFTVGFLGSAIGIRTSLGVSAACLCVATLALAVFMRRGARQRRAI